MSINVAINGFGRIGRMVFRQAIFCSDFTITAINARYSVETLVHLIKYDSIHGRFNGEVECVDSNHLRVNGKVIKRVNFREINQLPWGNLAIDIVIEATGKFKTRKQIIEHIKAGAKKVIVTAPTQDEDATIVIGVNDHLYEPAKHDIISNASCTTNCLAPIIKILDEKFGVKEGMMTTIHSFTNDQNNIDNPHKDLRRARACGESMIPTTTGAAEAIGKVLPHLKGKLTGMAVRIPTPNVSLIDLVVDVNKSTNVENLQSIYKKASETHYKGIVGYSAEPLVSIDYNTTSFSAIIDGLSTDVLFNHKIKLLAWYDNEWGYSARVTDLVQMVSRRII